MGELECNGVVEHFIQTSKEEYLYLHDFESLEVVRQEIDAFIERYNRRWLLERHGARLAAHLSRKPGPVQPISTAWRLLVDARA